MNSYGSKPVCGVIGAGFIGSSIISRLSSSGYTVKVLTRSFKQTHSLYKNTSFVYGDFSDYRLLDEFLNNVDVVIHLISSTVPCDIHVDFVDDLRQNLFSTVKFLEACSKHNIKQVLFASSASVYGDCEASEGFTELSLTNPISSHGMQKLAIEKYMLYYGNLNNLKIHILRISNPFGENQNINARQGFIAMTIGNIKKNQPVPISSNGLIIRDFLHVDNVAIAFQLCIEDPEVNSIVNVSSGEGRTLAKVIDYISFLSGINISLAPFPELPTNIKCSILSPTVLLKKIKNWPTISFADGIKSTLGHFSLYSPTKR